MRLQNIVDVETETHRDFEILRMSRPKLIETLKFSGCRDRYPSDLVDIETETSRDLQKVVETESRYSLHFSHILCIATLGSD